MKDTIYLQKTVEKIPELMVLYLKGIIDNFEKRTRKQIKEDLEDLYFLVKVE